MPAYSVSQVTSHLRQALETDPLLEDLWVVGEVSNRRVSTSGHSYYILKDEHAVLNCVMFRGQPGAELLANGTVISAHGRITFYEPRGSTDFMVDLAMPEGAGELSLELERLRIRLEAEGLFEESRKRNLPVFPVRVGLVTSPAGAVFHDIENVIQRRYPLTELVLSPTQVQGEGAAPLIATALEQLDRYGQTDVIIVARGGGSLEDLWPFNEEVVARSIYASRTPVVSAIGHETDYTIADYVADVRAPTPSAAAELVVPDQDVLRRQLTDLAEQCRRAAAYLLEGKRTGLAGLVYRMEMGVPNLETLRRRVDDVGRVFHSQIEGQFGLAKSLVYGLEQRMRALDPIATMNRGFSVVENLSSNLVISSASQVAGGDPLAITLADGVISATADRSGNNGRKKTKPGAAPQMMERLF